MCYGHATEQEKQVLNQLISQADQFPRDAALLTRLGAMLFSVCSFPPDEAQKYLYRALEIDPKNIAALFWLAKCWYHDFANPEKARYYLEQALAIDPYRADCLSLMSSVMIDLEADSATMLSYIDRAIAAAPDWIIPHKQRMWFLIDLKRFSEAEDEIALIEKLAAHPMPMPEDAIQEYYESCVTGRAARNTLKDLSEYRETIAQKRNSAP